MRLEQKKLKTGEQGFTMIELVLATLIFTFVMVVILASAFQIGRLYYKGISISNTNESTRTVVEDIASDVRFSHDSACADPVVNPQNCVYGGNVYYFCTGLHR